MLITDKFRKKTLFNYMHLTILLCGFLIVGCQSTQVQNEQKKNSSFNNIFHKDSTLYFANRTAPVSMRASFSIVHFSQPSLKTLFPSQTLVQSYKLQFRSISQNNQLIEQVTIITAGKKIILLDGPLFISGDTGLTLLSLEDSQFISKQRDVVLNFKYKNEAHFFSIQNHQLTPFSL